MMMMNMSMLLILMAFICANKSQLFIPGSFNLEMFDWFSRLQIYLGWHRYYFDSVLHTLVWQTSGFVTGNKLKLV